MNTSKLLFLIVIFSLSLGLLPASAVPGYTPHSADHFSYYDTIDVGSGTGYYQGYTDHTATNGMETMNTVFTNGTVSTNYSFSWTFTNSSSTTNGGSSGNFTWSSVTFLYVRGSDNQTGYTNPKVWFYMDNSTPSDGTFYFLDTLMTVKSRNYGFNLPSQNRYVNTIFAQGSGNYFRNDAYGQFSAEYTYSTYYDPSTGYIIGYGYVEHDTNSFGDGFTYTENLYVTSTSYPLAAGAPPSILSQYLPLIVGIVLVIAVIVVIVVVAVSRRGRVKLPKHAYQQEYRPPPPAAAPPPSIDLTPKQPPVQQIVVKEVVKVKCSYCGALIDSTAPVCPFCGGTSRT